jgi:murein DD-endopeptidase MepM/ murein hydrolase activator NlpD
MNVRHRTAYTILFFLITGLLPLFGQTADDPVRIYPVETSSGGFEIFADNKLPIPVWLSVEFPGLTNLEASSSLPFRGALAAGEKERKLLTLEPRDPAGRRGYRMVYNYAKGDPTTARPDPEFLYVFPWAHAGKHQITQGWHGKATHNEDNEFALDFDFDTGTPVHAARDGLVIEVKSDSNRGGMSQAYYKDANFILVAHSDGTFGNYVHLRRDGSLVKVGDLVKEGQPIGWSGNTGLSSGPHLHFDIRVPTREGKMMSIPVRFLGLDGGAVDPEENEFYYSVHRGQPSFPVVFGRDIGNDTYAGRDADVKEAGKPDIRLLQVDDTYVFFAVNPTRQTLEFTVDFKLVGMRSSLPEPLTLVVPPLKERYLLFLRPVRSASAWEYGYSWSWRPLPAGNPGR